MKILSKISIVIIVIFIWQNIYAREKVKVAVFDFKAINVPIYYATIAKSDVEGWLVNSGDFILLERTQVEIIYHEMQLKTRGNCDRSTCLVEVGKALSADLVITGGVHSSGGEKIISIKIIDVRNSKIISANSTAFTTDKELKKAGEKIGKSATKDIKKFALTGKGIENEYEIYTYTNVCYLMPLGFLKNSFKSGFGFALGGGLKNIFFNDFMLGLSGAFHSLSGLRQGKYLQFTFDMDYKYEIIRNFSLIPGISGGLNIMYYLRDYKYEERYLYGLSYDIRMHRKLKKSISTAGLLSGKINIDYSINSFISVHAGAGYNIFFEKLGYVNYLSFHLGTTIMF